VDRDRLVALAVIAVPSAVGLVLDKRARKLHGETGIPWKELLTAGRRRARDYRAQKAAKARD
jgi:hypothetical protein